MKREALVKRVAQKGGSSLKEPRRVWRVFAYRRPPVRSRPRFTT